MRTCVYLVANMLCNHNHQYYQYNLYENIVKMEVTGKFQNYILRK